VADPPRRVWRDWALVAGVAVGGIAEAVFRNDTAFKGLGVGWRVLSVAVLLATLPYALLIRRTQPLRALLVAFLPTLAHGVVMRIVEDGPSRGALSTSAIVLVAAYAVYRWGSGRDGLRGAPVLLTALVVGNLTGASSVGDVIGGSIVLAVPVLAGLEVRYLQASRARTLGEAQAREREVLSRERESLARELHDTVAHHVSAIVVQAQAGQAVASSDPQRAIGVLHVIEEEAARTLEEMRAIVDVLRAGADADLAPLHGLDDLDGLRRIGSDQMRVSVDIAANLGEVSPVVGAAIFRIAQESVTNAVRHARQATQAQVVVSRTDTGVRVAVVNDGAPAGPRGSGFGLQGMAERAALLGGRLEAGPLAAGGWQVAADLPSTMGG
jgi:signal transduction histidine kinase